MPFLGNIGPGELILVLIIALVVFGPGKLPDIGQALGKGIREFRKAASDVTEATRIDAPPATPPAAPPATPATTPPAASPPAAAPPPAAADAPAAATEGGTGDTSPPTA